MTNTTKPADSQATSIDTREFRELLGKMYGRMSFNYMRPNEETRAIFAYIDGKQKQYFEKIEELKARATAAEAQLAAIRAAVEGLTNPYAMGAYSGFADGYGSCKSAVLALLQPQPQAVDTSGLPG